MESTICPHGGSGGGTDGVMDRGETAKDGFRWGDIAGIRAEVPWDGEATKEGLRMGREFSDGANVDGRP